MSLRDQARALLEQASSRGAIKRLASSLDQDSALKQAVLDEGRARGVELPDEAIDWPAKRLLRLARGREDAARVRTNPVMRDEAFTCGHCGLAVPTHGRTARDHCPRCLRSLHVDIVPGDRAAGCGGLLDPVRCDRRGSDWVIHYRCRACGADRTNRALLDGDPPDDWEAVVALTVAER